MTDGKSKRIMLLLGHENEDIIKTKIYAGLFAHVTTANVLTAEPTIPAKMDPSTAWLTTISGNTLHNHEAALGTIR